MAAPSLAPERVLWPCVLQHLPRLGGYAAVGNFDIKQAAGREVVHTAQHLTVWSAHHRVAARQNTAIGQRLQQLRMTVEQLPAAGDAAAQSFGA